jgi:hypothetical protein
MGWQCYSHPHWEGLLPAATEYGYAAGKW